MTTSKARTLVSLRFASTSSYAENLERLMALINDSDDHAVIVAPEVCLTGYDYDHFQAAADFTPHALEQLTAHLGNKILIFTAIEQDAEGIYNVAMVLYKGRVHHRQAKAKLFAFGDEHLYFKAGNADAITTFEVDGMKMGIMICFELRFKTLWQQLEGADIIAIPARWGSARAQNFRSLTNALAIMNQCYVVASDASNEEFSGESGIISPFGVETRNGLSALLELPYDPTEIKRMRRYMRVGIA